MKILKTVLTLTLLLLAVAAARAEGSIQIRTEAIGHRTEGAYTWIRLEVSNPTPQPENIRIQLSGHLYKRHIHLPPFLLAPGESRTLNIPALMVGRTPHIRVQATSSAPRPIERSINITHQPFLHIAPLRDWTTQIEKVDFLTAIGHATGSSGNPGEMIREIEPDNLPDQWLCYSAFTAIFIPEAIFRRLPAQTRSALRDYANTGGEIVLYNSEQGQRETRLFGGIVRQKDHPIKNISSSPPEGMYQQARFKWEQFQDSRDLFSNHFPFNLKEESGKTIGLFLVTLFCILVGPVNYFYVSRRRKNLRLLFITVPVLSVTFCILIVLSFFLFQGLQRKGGTIALFTLDEAQDRGFQIAMHSLFTGVYPRQGLRFSEDTAFYPIRQSIHSRMPFSMDLEGGRRLQSGLIEASTNFHYVTARSFTSREKLIWEKQQQAVVNGFGVSITRLILFDNHNTWKAENIAPGGRAELSPGESLASFDQANLRTLLIGFFEQHQIDERFLSTLLNDMRKDPARPCYLILAEEPPAKIEPGIEMNQLGAYYLIFGIMEK